MISVSGATAWQLRSKLVGLSREAAADPEMVRNALPDVAEGEAEVKALKESCYLFIYLFFCLCCYYGMTGQESAKSKHLIHFLSTRLLQHRGSGETLYWNH